MGRFLLVILLLPFILPSFGKAQDLLFLRPEQDACGAIPICGNFHVDSIVYNGRGYLLEQLPQPTLGLNCFIESNSLWLRLKVSTPGTIAFTITPSTVYSFPISYYPYYVPTNDYDFSVYQVGNSSIPDCSFIPGHIPLRCNGEYAIGGLTGLAPNPPNTAYDNVISANAGDEYLILVNNSFDYATNYLLSHYYQALSPIGQPLYANGFSIDFTGSTATFSNAALPEFKSIENTCTKTKEISFHLSEPIKATSVAADGSDFYITPSSANIDKAYPAKYLHTSAMSFPDYPDSLDYTWDITVQFSVPLSAGNYVLHAAIGSDGNTLLDVCDGPQSSLDTISFNVIPGNLVSFTGLDSPACQFLVTGLSKPIFCKSIAQDGSDFKIIGPSSVNIKAAYPIHLNRYEYLGSLSMPFMWYSKEFTDTIVIELEEPIRVDGMYHLISQIGSDGNTMIDTCTGHQLPGDEISFNVNSYNGLLIAGRDTTLCKADTIQFHATSSALMDPTSCGVGANATNGLVIISEIKGSSDQPSWGRPGAVLPDAYGHRNIAIGTRWQSIFQASELKAFGFKPGDITKVGWTVIYHGFGIGVPPDPPANLVYGSVPDLTIRMMCTNEQSMQIYPLSGGQIVYQTSNYIPHLGFNEFVLDTPFAWDGVSNLVIETCNNVSDSLLIPSGGFSNGVFLKYETTAFKSTIEMYGGIGAQGVDGCSLQSTIAGGATGNAGYYRPETALTMVCPPMSEGSAYQWSPVSNLIGDSSTLTTSVYSAMSTKYVVSVVDRFGCYLRDSARIDISELNTWLSPADTAVCQGDKVQIMVDGGISPVDYSWSTFQPSTLSCLDCNEPIVSPLESSRYQVTITDKYGCADTLQSMIQVNPLPVITCKPSDTIIKYGTELQLSSSGALHYTWSPASYLSDFLSANPIVTPEEATYYVVMGTSAEGCHGTDTIRIGVDYRDHLKVPSAFSPNGDGLNDIFHVTNLSFQRIQEFKVFNRWGGLVFAAFDNKGWDGTMRGEPQDMGVYHYLIRVGYPDGYSELLKGDVSLIK